MRAILVDDDPKLVDAFAGLASGISDLEVVGQFTDAPSALEFARNNRFEAVFLDIVMPGMDGLNLALRLREFRSDLLVVLMTEHMGFVRDANRIGVDYYLVKPFGAETLQTMMGKLRLLAQRQEPRVFIQTFGRFLVRLDGQPIRLTGKAKEILALVVTRQGGEVSNEEIYSTLWEGRPYDNDSMGVFYNALRRLRNALEEAGIGNLLVSTGRGQTVDTSLFDCDLYAWRSGTDDPRSTFEGEFLSEYSWGEYLLGGGTP